MNNYPQFVCFGDSITERGETPDGWVTLLRSHLVRRCDVINRGMSGFNSKFLKEEVIDKIVDKPLNYVATLLIGSNDICAGGERYVSLKDYEEYLRCILKRLSETFEHVIVMTIPRYFNPDWEAYLKKEGLPVLDPPRSLEMAMKYNTSLKEIIRLANEENKNSIVTVDLFEEMGKCNWRELLCDGLHLSPPGQQFVAQQIRKVIKDHSFDMVIPQWKEIADRNKAQEMQNNLKTII
ncbi:hypothetical protein SNEBB_009898 [Seison nebaliae]|nr:hypothetical protein SNEBB_009898 [Seison nebaliae]